MTTEGDDPLAALRVAIAEAGTTYRAVLDAVSDAILVADFETALFVDCNRAALDLYGYSIDELRTMTGRSFAPPGALAEFEAVSAQVRRDGYGSHRNIPMMRKDGSVFIGDLKSSPFELAGRRVYVAVVRDVTERVQREHELREAHQRLIEASRLAAIGQLAAAVAHEVNNPAAFVLANLEQLRASLGSGGPEDAGEMIADAIEGAQRIVSIVAELKAFARSDPPALSEVDLDEVVRAASKLVRNQIVHRARLVMRLGSPPPLLADRAKLAQVITNLLVNAAHAIEDDAANAEIVVETSSSADAVRLVVADTGCGIPEEHREKIFEPFFTTKSRDLGTGLGLSVCREIVQRHGGTIHVESEVGRGSRFEVTLPRARVASAARPRPGPAPIATRKLRVLLVDDEPLILRAYERILSPPHEVVTADSGSAALAIVARDRAWDVIVCDLMMPGVDGVAFHAALRDDAEELVDRCLFCTGGVFTERARAFVERLQRPVLAKPITPEALRKAVLEAAERARSAETSRPT